MVTTQSNAIVSLPRPLTSLVGRQQELEHIYDLLQSDARLVTITGIGGVGKTRLALQAALELEPNFEAGALFVPLASVTRGSSIPVAIANVAGLDESVDSVEALLDMLGPASRLLVLDNLEQIPDAAPIVMEILQYSPSITVLCTSQSRVELSGENLVPLEPFNVDPASPADLAARPAVQLFISRAREIKPSLPTDDESIAIVGQIVQMLDGIPLAVELAAARVAIFPLSELRVQLNHRLPVLASRRVDLPTRQRTMRDAIAWTYELLEPADQRLFNWLSVYERDFSLDSVRHVAEMLEMTETPLDLVHELVSRNLLRQSRFKSESSRYQMLEMMREYGHERLIATNEDHLARRSHGMDMVALAERAEPHLVTEESAGWSRLLNDDMPNIYGALEWSGKSDQHVIGQRIFAAIWRFFENIGIAKRILAYAPNTDVGTADDYSRARALVAIGYLNERIRHLEPCKQAFTEARNLAENLPDQIVHVRALTGLGTVAFDYSDIEQTQHYLNEAKQLAQQIGDTRGQMTSTGMLAVMEIQLGNFEEAISNFQTILKLAEEMGDAVSLSSINVNIGISYQSLDRFEDAEESLIRALAISEEAGDVSGIAFACANLAGNCAKLNKYDESVEYAEKGLVAARESGLKHAEATLLINLGSIKHRQRDFGANAVLTAQAAKLMDFDGGAKEQIHFASIMCETCLELDLPTEAAEMLGAVIAMREHLQVANREIRGEAEDEALAILDPSNNPQYAEAMAHGAALDRSALVDRIQEVSKKIVAVCPPGSPLPAEKSATSAYALTPRETEVLTLVARGFTNAELAEEMFVSTRTITTHLSNIFNKLGVTNRSRAIALAHSEGLI